MNNDSPQKALLVIFLVALVCSVLVSVAAVSLRPIQLLNQLVERSRNIVALSGIVEPGQKLSSDEILAAIEQLDVRIVDIDSGKFDDSKDPNEFDPRAAANDPDLGVAIPADADSANLGRRTRYEIVHLVWDGDELSRVILPIVGQGMWSTLYGYIALEADLNTIAAVSFYEQAETAGLGDQIVHPDWQAKWVGRELFGSDGSVRFRIAAGPVDAGSSAARNQVDGLTGATVTANAVTRLIAYWFGPHGYSTFLDNLGNQPPVRVAAQRGQE
ncbi:MAG: Na(+)-translocating NADH-quinone reductase subunit C [Gammaproteobacteria bacterium]|nr:MAG: Na(+)-translocating NADH-quinone reductase subunit C [Gammaproteobacteria bacterium]